MECLSVRGIKGAVLVSCIAALALTGITAPAEGSVTIGQVDPAPGSLTCGTNDDWAQLSVSSGNSYMVPEVGMITSWSHNAISGTGQSYGLKIFRHVTGNEYAVVGHDGPHNLAPSALNTFQTNIPVKPGDLVGVHTGTGAVTGCGFGNTSATDTYLLRANSDLADGASGVFAPFQGRLNISAELQPDNDFTIGAIRRNRKKGTATVSVTVPNPGEVKLFGHSIKTAGASQAVIAKTVTAPGEVLLKVRAKGAAARVLNENGKVKVEARITYTPTGGNPRTQARKVRLKKS
jgi:hypothetical protein